MSISKCSNCGNRMFQVEALTPFGSEKDILCVICNSCSNVVGTLNFDSDADQLKEFELKLSIMNKKLDTINNNIGQLINGLKLVYKKLEE